MRVDHEELEVCSNGKGLYEITDKIQTKIDRSGVRGPSRSATLPTAEIFSYQPPKDNGALSMTPTARTPGTPAARAVAAAMSACQSTGS